MVFLKMRDIFFITGLINFDCLSIMLIKCADCNEPYVYWDFPFFNIEQLSFYYCSPN